jgi:hypothetical protein
MGTIEMATAKDPSAALADLSEPIKIGLRLWRALLHSI